MKWLSNNNFMSSVILSVNTQKLKCLSFSSYCSSIDLQVISWDKNNVSGDLKWAVVSVVISSLVIYWRKKAHFNLSSHNKKFLVTKVFKTTIELWKTMFLKKWSKDCKKTLTLRDHRSTYKHAQGANTHNLCAYIHSVMLPKQLASVFFIFIS